MLQILSLQVDAYASRCTLPSPTIFHDIPLMESGKLIDAFGVYSIVGNTKGFTLSSLNATFPPITAKWHGKSGNKVRAFFPNLNATLQGEVDAGINATLQGEVDAGIIARDEECIEFIWSPINGGFYTYDWSIGSLPPAAPACNFSDAVWHSEAASPFSPPDAGHVFLLNSIDPTHFTIHSLNGSFTNVTARVRMPLSGDFRVVSANFSDKPAGAPTSRGIMQGALDGDSNCELLKWPDETYSWAAGPLPPPPPPPPLGCEDVYNRAACAGVQPPAGRTVHCEWCTSDDGLHHLCFQSGEGVYPPQTGWACVARVRRADNNFRFLFFVCKLHHHV
jgi:hypothetical protein